MTSTMQQKKTIQKNSLKLQNYHKNFKKTMQIDILTLQHLLDH